MASSTKTYISSFDWANIRACTILRLVGSPLKVVAPPGCTLVYEPLLGGNAEAKAVTNKVQQIGSENRSLTEDPEAILDLLGTLYARIGIIDNKGRCLASAPVSLGAAVVDIVYRSEGDPSSQAQEGVLE